MDRLEIKSGAKNLAFNNKWVIWEPVIYFALFAAAIGFFQGMIEVFGNLEIFVLAFEVLYILVSVVFSVAYLNYVVSFTRGYKKNIMTLMKEFQEELLSVLAIMLIVFLIVLFWSIFLIIPGIIAAYVYYMVLYVKAMNKEYSYKESIKEGKKLMRGKKMDFFIFQLSFIPWIILCIITLGLALIWFIPYYTIAEAMYYEKLVELNQD